MLINGMTVAAAFNGGGVSSLTYDTNNVEEVSVLVSGGLGESETGGPTMNIVPRSGGNRFAGQAFYNTAGKWSTGDNVDDDAALQAAIAQPAGASSTRRTRARRSAARSSATGCGSTAAYRKFSTDAGARGHVRQQERRRRGALGLSARTPASSRERSRAATSGQARVTGAGHREEPRDVLARAAAPLRGLDAHDRAARAAASATTTGSALGSTHAVAGSEHRLLRPAVRRDAGDVDDRR